MSNPMEKATVYLSKLEADRIAAMELSKEKELEAMLIKAQEEGFREAMVIFGLNNSSNISHNHFEAASHKTHRTKRRDIRQMILQELSYSAKTMTTRQIAKAIDNLPDRTEAALKGLQDEGKTVQHRDGLWEVVLLSGASPDRLTVAA